MRGVESRRHSVLFQGFRNEANGPEIKALERIRKPFADCTDLRKAGHLPPAKGVVLRVVAVDQMAEHHLKAL